MTATLINSSQGAGERGKASLKLCCPHDESIAKGAMDEEEDRSGKAAAGCTPDELMKVAAMTNETEKDEYPLIRKSYMPLLESLLPFLGFYNPSFKFLSKTPNGRMSLFVQSKVTKCKKFFSMSSQKRSDLLFLKTDSSMT